MYRLTGTGHLNQTKVFTLSLQETTAYKKDLQELDFKYNDACICQIIQKVYMHIMGVDELHDNPS